MSKMGISTLASYSGAQIFQAIGLHPDVIDFAFTGTASQVKGLSFREIAEETLARHERAFAPDAKLTDEGIYRFRRDGETARLDAARPAKLPHLRRHQGRGQGGQVGGLREVCRRGGGSRAGRAAPVPRA